MPFHCPVNVVGGTTYDTALAELIGERSWALFTSRFWIGRGVDREIGAGAGILPAYVAEVDPNPKLSRLMELAEAMPAVDVVVALGGGSVIDMAKGVVAVKGMTDGGKHMNAHLKQGTPLPPSLRPLPIIAVPTTSGSGSEVTRWGTIWGDDGIKFSVNDPKLYPSHAVLDAALCQTMPRELTLASGLDALSHAMEAVWNRRHTPLTDAIAVQAISLVRQNLNTALVDRANLDARQNLQAAALIAGLAMGTTQTALAHSISYPFTSKLGIPHGLACSFTLAEIAAFNAAEAPERMTPIGQGLGCAPEDVSDALMDWFGELGLADVLAPYVSPEMVDDFGDNLITRARAANNIRDADGPTARQIARTALERLNGARTPRLAAGE